MSKTKTYCTSILITKRMEKLDMSMTQRCIYISQLIIFKNTDDDLMTCFIQLSFIFIFRQRKKQLHLHVHIVNDFSCKDTKFLSSLKRTLDNQSPSVNDLVWRNSHLNLILFLRMLFFHASQKAITAWDTTLSCVDFFSLLTPSITGSKIVSRACSMYKLCSVGSSENHHKYILNY